MLHCFQCGERVSQNSLLSLYGMNNTPMSEIVLCVIRMHFLFFACDLTLSTLFSCNIRPECHSEKKVR